jgi:hypothetical protein
VHETCFTPLMSDEAKTPRELAAMIKEQAVLSLGPWPADLRLMIFGQSAHWSCGLSPAMQASDLAYRGGVLEIARDLRKTVVHKPR